MKRAVVLSVLLAILPLILSFATVVAQDEPSVMLDSAFMPQVQQTEVAASQQLLLPAQQDVTPTPNRCEVNFFTTTRQGVSARYYLYLSKWLAFSLSGATGQVTLHSETYGFTLYRGKADFVAKTFTVSSVNSVEADTDFVFSVDTVNSPQMMVVFDCVSDVEAFNGEMTGEAFSNAVDTNCTVLNRPRINSVTLPGIYTFGNVYILPIFNTAGTLLLTSSLQSFSTSTQLQVDSKVGKWFEEVSVAMVARGIEAGWTEYMTTSAVTSFVTNAPINAGDASLSVVGCE